MTSPGRVEWFRVLPFFLLHAACLLVLVVGWSWIAVATAIVVHFARVFGLTAFYHRYFSHRAFKTSRLVQFLGALLGSSAGQRGPIWWSAHHRHHHRASDQPSDIHSPGQQGFMWSHMLWFMTSENYRTNERVVKDWIKFSGVEILGPVRLSGPGVAWCRHVLLRSSRGKSLARIRNQRPANVSLGLYCFDHYPVPRHLRHQFTCPRLRNTKVSDE